jgi:hypothetical protein
MPHRLSPRRLLPALAVLALAAPGAARAADVPFAGTWKVVLHEGPRAINLCLVKIEARDGKPAAAMISAGFPNFASASLEDVRIDARSVHFQLKNGPASLPITVRARKGDVKPGRLFGTTKAGPVELLTILEKTTDTKIEPQKAVTLQPAFTEMGKLARAGAAEKAKGLLKILADHADEPAAYAAAQELLNLKAAEAAAGEADLKAALERLEKISQVYGPTLDLQTWLGAAGPLAKARNGAALATDLVKKAEGKASEGPASAGTVLRILALKASLKGFAAADLDAGAKKFLQLTRPGNRVQELQVNLTLARTLAGGPAGAPLAVEYAKKAEGLLTKDDPLDRSAEVLTALAAALHKADKGEEAKAATARAEKIGEQLDAEFEKTSIPFTPEKFAGRTGKSRRAAVVELFTGAQCPPCVSADIAFDAALKTYPDADVVFLEYHLHIPGPDPLTNADSEARQAYYGVNATPTMFLDGKATPPMGGPKQAGEARYKSLSELINQELEKDAAAGLHLKVTRSGDKVNISAAVSDLKEGGKVRLRFVLVEDVARYPGRNRQRLHHHVVRAFPGGVEGQALKGAKGSHSASIDLTALRERLGAYLDEAAQQRPFLDEQRPMALRNLRVVALLQDDDSKAILQAAQMPVPAER